MKEAWTYGIEEYLYDLIDLGYSNKEIKDIIKVGDIRLSDKQNKILSRKGKGNVGR